MESAAFTIPLVATPGVEGRSSSAVRPLLRHFFGGADNALVRQAFQLFLDGDEACNPLVLWGSADVGKTQLARALVHRRLAGSQPGANGSRRNGSSGAVMLTGREFARHFADAVDADAMDDFRRRHRGAKILCIDGLETLGPREAAQIELLYTLDALLAERHPIVVTSRQPPIELPWLHPGLASRLSGGLVVPVKPPNQEARTAILTTLAADRRLAAPTHRLAELAGLAEGTAPQLSTMIAELANFVADEPAGIDPIALFAELFTERETPSLSQITQVVCRFFRVKATDLKGPTRRKGVVQARQIAMYLARQLTGSSLQAVGRHFGGRDHTTVLHACCKTEELAQNDATTVQALLEIRQLLRSHN